MTQAGIPRGQGFSYLSELSPRDIRWDERKLQSLAIADLYAETHYDEYMGRIRGCSGWLGFALESLPGSEEQVFKLRDARFCRVRHCSICQWRRSLMWQARFHSHLPRIREDYPTHQFIFLMLSVPNCPLEELRSTLTEMNRGWNRFTLRKEFPATGWIRNVEVTRAENDYAHPHFHVLMMVPPGYFAGHSYLSHAKWVALWRSCMRMNLDPRVHVQKVKLKHAHTSEVGQSDPDLSKAISYTFKYSVKPEVFLDDDRDPGSGSAWLVELTKQLHKTKAIALGGVFKKYLSEQEPENFICSEEVPEELAIATDDRVWANWREKVKRYTIKENAETLTA